MGGGGRYIDRALAAAQRADLLEQHAPAVCNHIAGLLAKGATVGAVRMYDDGRIKVDAAITATAAADEEAAVGDDQTSRNRASTIMAERQQRVHRQLVHCLSVETRLLRMVYSHDLLLATTSELARTSKALRSLTASRIDIFALGGGRSREGRQLGEDAGGEDGDGVHISARTSANSSVVPLLSTDKAAEAPATELYFAVSREFRTRKGWSLAHLTEEGGGKSESKY